MLNQISFELVLLAFSGRYIFDSGNGLGTEVKRRYYGVVCNHGAKVRIFFSELQEKHEKNYVMSENFENAGCKILIISEVFSE